MKRFIIKLFIFLGSVLLIIVVGLVSVNQIMKHKGDFQLRPGTKHIILGQSHSMCAYHDNYITDFHNVSNCGESYFYSLAKLNQILIQNPKIETVFIEFTNSQIVENTEQWIFQDKYISYHYRMFSPYISLKDKLYLFRKNPQSILRIIPKEIKLNLIKIIKKDYSFRDDMGYAANTGSLNVYLDSLENGVAGVEMLKIDNSISEIHLSYLDRIIDLLKINKKNVILIRTPIHKDYKEYFFNEKLFQTILKERYSDTKFVDFVDFPLDDSCYKDFRHLNKTGSIVFSKYFNSYLNDSIIK